MNKGNQDSTKIKTISSKQNKKESCCCDNTETQLSLRSITQLVYGCQILSLLLFGVAGIVGVVINYIKLNDVKGTWLLSHFTWQIRTFWIGLAVSVIGFLSIFLLIGFFVLIANVVWVIYRVVKGWLLLSENKPIKNPYALL